MAKAGPAAAVHPLHPPQNNNNNNNNSKTGSLSSGSVPKALLGSPSRKKTGSKSAGSLRRLSTISEQEADKLDGSPASHESWGGGGGGEWTPSSFSVCSDKLKSSGSGRFSSEDSFQSEPGGTHGSPRGVPQQLISSGCWCEGPTLGNCLSDLVQQTTAPPCCSPACTAASTSSWCSCRTRARGP